MCYIKSVLSLIQSKRQAKDKQISVLSVMLSKRKMRNPLPPPSPCKTPWDVP